jgi:putative ABC transport system ATP-binding protein
MASNAAPDEPPAEPHPEPRLSLRGLRSDLAGPFDFTLAAGACATVGGASGSGKSLFLRMIADLDPNEGEVRLDGGPRAAMAAPDWRRRVPYVAAESGWWRDTVVEHFAPDKLDQARALAARLGVGAAQVDGPVIRLSTGERQRLALVRALVLESPVLLLDEPTGPLDPVSVGQVEGLLRERLAAGVSVLLVSHDPAQAARLGATRYVMRDRHLAPAA